MMANDDDSPLLKKVSDYNINSINSEIVVDGKRKDRMRGTINAMKTHYNPNHIQHH